MTISAFPQQIADEFLWPQRRIEELEKVIRALLDSRSVWEKFPRSAAGPLCIFCQTRCGHEAECPIQLAQEAK